jgi:hypothetical protein
VKAKRRVGENDLAALTTTTTIIISATLSTRISATLKVAAVATGTAMTEMTEMIAAIEIVIVAITEIIRVIASKVRVRAKGRVRDRVVTTMKLTIIKMVSTRIWLPSSTIFRTSI